MFMPYCGSCLFISPRAGGVGVCCAMSCSASNVLPVLLCYIRVIMFFSLQGIRILSWEVFRM